MAAGKLAASLTVANTNLTAYTVSTNCLYAVISVMVLNPTGSNSTVSIALSPTATPGAANYIEQGATILANGGGIERDQLVVSPQEIVVVNTSVSNCVVRVSGIEYTKF